MATLSNPNRQIIEAMEELGLLGWLPNRRWGIRTRSSGTRRSVAPARQNRGLPAGAPAVGVLAGGVLAAGAVALGGAGDGRLRPLRVLTTAVLCGVGILGAWVLLSTDRASR